MMKNILTYNLKLAVIVFVLAGTGWAQSPPRAPSPDSIQPVEPVTPDQTVKPVVPVFPALEWLKQDKADEYLFILDKLRKELTDYHDYATTPGNLGGHVSLEKLSWIKKRLNAGKYSNQPQTLLDDLTELISKIRREESDHRLKINSADSKCCRSARSFRRELSVISELIEEYTDNQGIEFLANKEIYNYISEYFKKVQSSDNNTLPSIFDANNHKSLPAPSAFSEMEIINRVLKREIDKLLTESPGLNKQYLLNMTVENDLPIKVNCPSGIIQIIGSDHYQIKASLTVIISAASKMREKELSEMISISGSNHDDGYILSVNLPPMSDIGADISRSVLLVEVPRNNPVICKSSFADLTIANLEASLDINSTNSNIQVEDINADVTLNNSMGEVLLNGIDGDITVHNSNASIELSDCNGTMVIENLYSDIRLTGTSGDVRIRNSGYIKIRDHSGQLNLDNNYGKIEVKNVDGELIAKNSYKPLIVSRISGSTWLKNEYSSIKVNHVGGLLSITNREGSIFAEAISGPVEIDNRGGMINLILDDNFSGISSINGYNGTIHLTLIGDPDIDLRVHTIDGSISSSLPISVTDLRGIQSAELMFGGGGNILDIAGKNATIIINSR